MIKSLFYTAGLVVALAGCSNTPISTTAEPSATVAVASPKSLEAPAVKTVPTVAAQSMAKTLPPYLDPASALSTRQSIYFDFDDFSIKKEFGAMLEMHGKYLANNPSISIKIEGNSDERGGAEYNLALGQKRAEAVARAIKLFGLKQSQVEATSWGEEKPKVTGHDEAAWAQNRRVDLGYPKQ
jgi:peptidoglycan-associated lipoprotein